MVKREYYQETQLFNLLPTQLTCSHKHPFLLFSPSIGERGIPPPV